MKLGSAKNLVFYTLIISIVTGTLGTLAYAQSVAPASSTALVQPNLNGVADVFIGRNTKGPYMLSWKKIEAGSDVIIRDGMTLSRGSDYQIDYETGMIAFTSTLGQDSIARATYSYKSGQAVTNAPGMVLPVTLNILNRGNSNLQVLGLYKEQAPGKPESGTTIFGIGGSTKFSKSEFSTTFLTTTPNADAQQETPGLLDRSGMKLGAKSSLGKLNLIGSYARAGDEFTGSKEYGLKSGSAAYDLGASMQASDAVYASLSFNKVEDVDGENKGAATTSQQEKIVLGTDKTPKLTATLSEQETVNAAGEAVGSATINKYVIENKFGDKMSAAAAMETNVVTNGQSTSTTDTQSIGLNATPITGVQISGNHTIVDSDSLGEVTTTNINIAAKPRDDLTINAGFFGKDSSATGQEETRNLSIVSNPMKQLMVKLGYQGKDSDALGLEEARDVRVESQPLDFMKFIGAYGAIDTAAGTNTSKEARVEIKPIANAIIGGGYKATETAASIETVKDVSGAVKASKYVELTGSYKSRESTSAEQLDSSAVKVALSPNRRFKLTGSYETNPEDKNGLVQKFDSRGLGLETKIGSLILMGGYAQKDEYVIGKQGSERQVGANMPIFNGRLTTGYKESETRMQSQEATITYSLGYQHNLGSSFALSLTGEMTQYEREQALMEDQTEYKAEAKLGMRF